MPLKYSGTTKVMPHLLRKWKSCLHARMNQEPHTSTKKKWQNQIYKRMSPSRRRDPNPEEVETDLPVPLRAKDGNSEISTHKTHLNILNKREITHGGSHWGAILIIKGKNNKLSALTPALHTCFMWQIHDAIVSELLTLSEKFKKWEYQNSALPSLTFFISNQVKKHLKIKILPN